MFILKNLIAIFLSPLIVSLLFILTGLYFLWGTRKQLRGKILITIGACSLFLFSFPPFTNMLLSPLEMETSGKTVNDEDMQYLLPVRYIVVLGGGHISDPDIPVTSQINQASLTRIVEGIRQYRLNPGSKLVFTGGAVFDPKPEAETMAEIALGLGMSMEDIILEIESRDTNDHPAHLNKIIHSEPFILVTSASHMPRSLALFEKWGMKPIPAPTNYLVREMQTMSPHHYAPGASGLQKSERAIHEYLGTLWADLNDQI